jgi:hypothetical protein
VEIIYRHGGSASGAAAVTRPLYHPITAPL